MCAAVKCHTARTLANPYRGSTFSHNKKHYHSLRRIQFQARSCHQRLPITIHYHYIEPLLRHFIFLRISSPQLITPESCFPGSRLGQDLTTASGRLHSCPRPVSSSTRIALVHFLAATCPGPISTPGRLPEARSLLLLFAAAWLVLLRSRRILKLNQHARM